MWRLFLERNGFTIFLGHGFQTWENRPLNNGGIRIEIVDDVAEINCRSPLFSDTVPLKEVENTVKKLMGIT